MSRSKKEYSLVRVKSQATVESLNMTILPLICAGVKYAGFSCFPGGRTG